VIRRIPVSVFFLLVSIDKLLSAIYFFIICLKTLICFVEANMKKNLEGLLSIVHENISDVPFGVRFWDGDTISFGSGKALFTLIFKTERSARRVFSEGSLGFGEEYVAGNIVVEGDFKTLMRLGTDGMIQNMKLPLKTKLALIVNHFRSLNTKRGSLNNVSHHYDRGNDFYRLYLDETMTYSCAYFRDGNDSLEQAQQQKYEHICRKLQLRQGETLLDIGCGWGGMLIYAARHYGTKGVGYTLSRGQAEYSRQLIREMGLEKKIEIVLDDYRHIAGQFDKFVSIGMFEHVGKSRIPIFMKQVGMLLKPGGVGLLHTIGKERKTPSDAWTMKYIFPGGYIPVLDHVIKVMGKSGFVPMDIENLRLHYAATLDQWAQRFEANANKIESMFDEKFVRMWRIYLNGSAAAFRNGDLRLYQILFTKGLNNQLPLTREHMYLTSQEKTQETKYLFDFAENSFRTHARESHHAV
jgi:cyclopropane-fatty-acyl-phospholipid synthase